MVEQPEIAYVLEMPYNPRVEKDYYREVRSRETPYVTGIGLVLWLEPCKG